MNATAIAALTAGLPKVRLKNVQNLCVRSRIISIHDLNSIQDAIIMTVSLRSLWAVRVEQIYGLIFPFINAMIMTSCKVNVCFDPDADLPLTAGADLPFGIGFAVVVASVVGFSVIRITGAIPLPAMAILGRFVVAGLTGSGIGFEIKVGCPSFAGFPKCSL